jgi:sec-independent protein translocase protein TatB
MLNISFSEIIFILILAFVILGPEKLPKAAYSLGLIIKKIKQQYSNFQAELNKAINTEKDSINKE